MAVQSTLVLIVVVSCVSMSRTDWACCWSSSWSLELSFGCRRVKSPSALSSTLLSMSARCALALLLMPPAPATLPNTFRNSTNGFVIGVSGMAGPL